MHVDRYICILNLFKHSNLFHMVPTKMQAINPPNENIHQVWSQQMTTSLMYID